jgi:cell wall-associated NlpC family hydrolase
VAGEGISGTAVAVATAGAVLVYAGFRGVSPLQALRDATNGSTPPAPVSAPTSLDLGTSGVTGGSGFATGKGTALLAEMQRIGTGKGYSQLRRTGPNSFDCSGLVWKAGSNLSIWPAGTTAFNTASFVVHTKAFGLSDVGSGNGSGHKGSPPQAGDIIWWVGHMGVATDGTDFFSALSTRSGIRTLPITTIDKQHGTHHVFRFTGSVGGASNGSGGGGGSW